MYSPDTATAAAAAAACCASPRASLTSNVGEVAVSFDFGRRRVYGTRHVRAEMNAQCARCPFFVAGIRLRQPTDVAAWKRQEVSLHATVCVVEGAESCLVAWPPSQ